MFRASGSTTPSSSHKERGGRRVQGFRDGVQGLGFRVQGSIYHNWNVTDLHGLRTIRDLERGSGLRAEGLAKAIWQPKDLEQAVFIQP